MLMAQSSGCAFFNLATNIVGEYMVVADISHDRVILNLFQDLQQGTPQKLLPQ